MFDDESTRVLVRAALELALAEGSHVQIAMRNEPHTSTERKKFVGVPKKIGANEEGIAAVTVALDGGGDVSLPVEHVYGVRRV